MTDSLVLIREEYADLKSRCAQDCRSAATGEAIRDLTLTCMRFLASKCAPVDLVSHVPGKRYVSFARRDAPGTLSRPANCALFIDDAETVAGHWRAWLDGRITQADFRRMSYTVALAPCLAMELFDRQNKKGPATYFECFIGHIFAKALGVNPQKSVALRVQDRSVRLTMDYLFDMRNKGSSPNGPTGVRIHLPVKMSTRERVVQAWAHQRILDCAYGEGTFKGIMVLFSETKLDSRSHEVVEICVPDQWLTYQSLLSRMVRIYYFDVPARYQTLADAYPGIITIKQFGEFFTEKESVLRA